MTAPDTRPSCNYLCLYSVSRLYGGPEEGGWWYDHYSPIAALVVTKPVVPGSEEAERARAVLLHGYSWDNPRGRGSVIGGADPVVLYEDSLFGHETKERPHYE